MVRAVSLVDFIVDCVDLLFVIYTATKPNGETIVLGTKSSVIYPDDFFKLPATFDTLSEWTITATVTNGVDQIAATPAKVAYELLRHFLKGIL